MVEPLAAPALATETTPPSRRMLPRRKLAGVAGTARSTPC